jgi:hypothetical protein
MEDLHVVVRIVVFGEESQKDRASQKQVFSVS